MRKLSFFLAFALVLTFACGVAQATSLGIISLDNTTNEYSATQLRAGKTHVVSIHYDLTANASENYWIGSNGFEVYSPDGADWVYLQGASGPLVDLARIRHQLPDLPTALSRFRKHFQTVNRITGPWIQTDNFGADPALLGSQGINSAAGFFLATMSVPEPGETQLGGYLHGESGIAVLMEFETLLADSNLTMCVDSNNVITAWEWSSAGVDDDYPQWDNGDPLTDGPRCWDIFIPENIPPVWCDGPDQGTEPDLEGSAVPFNHCGEGTYTLCATDPDVTGEVTYYFHEDNLTGFGEINGNVWTWIASMGGMPQSGNPDIKFWAWDTQDSSLMPFTLHTTITNNAPTFTTCPSAQVTVSAGTDRMQTVVFSDPDVCDAPTITITEYLEVDGGDVLSPAVGVPTTSGDITFNPGTLTLGARVVTMTVEVSDGLLTEECVLEWNVIIGSGYQVELQKVEGQLQGHFTDVFIKLHSVNPEFGLGGFDFLVAYDASALAFQLAYEGDVYGTPYNWEYFTYRFGGYGNCGNACPSGMLRVIGLAEINDGAATATCVDDAGDGLILAYLRFLVSNDRTLECQYVPVRFFWYDCTDNILSSCDGSKAYLSAAVFDYKWADPYVPFIDTDITNPLSGFPTFTGAQDECELDDPEIDKWAIMDVDFQNGGVDIICGKDIDARGDINLNGLPYEIADAVMFTNYFISGLGAFGTHIEGSIAASDTNADGITLSVADLVYLVRVVIGDAQPYPKTAPISARVTYGNDRFNVDVEMGAAHIVMTGNVTPTLLADNMEMRFASNGEITNILVYSTEANQSFSGDFLEVSGDVVSTEFATFLGATVVAKVMPSTFEVEQNYPNPFNPTTTFKFTIPNGGAWKLGVYNITGQLVESFSGVSELGFETVVWDASNLSSGIYFYRVSTEEHSMTKKAVLLK